MKDKDWSEAAATVFNEVFPNYRVSKSEEAEWVYQKCQQLAEEQDSSRIYQDVVGMAIQELIERLKRNGGKL